MCKEKSSYVYTLKHYQLRMVSGVSYDTHFYRCDFSRDPPRHTFWWPLPRESHSILLYYLYMCIYILYIHPIGSTYGIFTCIWLIFVVNDGKCRYIYHHIPSKDTLCVVPISWKIDSTHWPSEPLNACQIHKTWLMKYSSILVYQNHPKSQI